MDVKEAICRFEFEALPDFFFNYREKAQQDPSFRAKTLPALGLINKPYDADGLSGLGDQQKDTQRLWQGFKSYVEQLNAQDLTNSTTYKVLYITRHGLGYHNVYESQVGREAWNSHWSHLDGDGKTTWADSMLNEDGIKQAQSLGQFWSDSVTNDSIPIPGTIYTSPLARCLETTRLVFANVMKEQGAPFCPIVKELLRERLTDHTCDRRSSKSWIQEHYPGYVIEPNFSEEDVLWSGGSWESLEEHIARKHQLLEDIFETDMNSFVALTTHSYAISAILRTIGLTEFRVSEGSSIAFLVKATRVTPTL